MASRSLAVLNFLTDLLSKYCCCCSCCQCCQSFYQPKILPEEINTALDDSQPSSPFKSPPDRVSDHFLIKKFVRKWEGKFWPQFWKEHRELLLRREAATRIQAIIRGYLGRRYYERQYQRALSVMNDFWRRKRELKLLEKEKQKITKVVRGKVSSPTPWLSSSPSFLHVCLCLSLSDGVTTRKRYFGKRCFEKSSSGWCRYDPTVRSSLPSTPHSLTPRAWRGLVGRSIASYFLMLAKQLRLNKPAAPPSRFKSEVFRRIWARKKFVPTGGWPGKADFKEFNMWDHVSTPPRGNKYGLKTHKVRPPTVSHCLYFPTFIATGETPSR
jgi:hypothetical protein